MKKAFLVLFLSLLVLTGCRHTSPFESPRWFQALGEDGEYVISADMARIRNGEIGEFPEAEGKVLKRADRVTLSLAPDEGGSGSALKEGMVLSGALEGNYGKALTSTALSFSSGFEKTRTEAGKAWTNGNLTVRSPESGIVLFTEGDYASFEERTYANRELLIDDETAEKMSSSLVSLYVKNPETLVDLGFEIPSTVLEEMEKTLLLFSGHDGGLRLSGRLEMKDQGAARAILTLLKNQMIQEAKRKGEAIDYKAASGYFIQDGSFVLIEDYPLSGEMLEKGKRIVSSSLGGLN